MQTVGECNTEPERFESAAAETDDSNQSSNFSADPQTQTHRANELHRPIDDRQHEVADRGDALQETFIPKRGSK
jgi:hypothetical protein